MNNTVENDFFWISQEKWQHVTGEVDKSVWFSCQIFWGFNVLKSIKIGWFLTKLFKEQKGGRFLWYAMQICYIETVKAKLTRMASYDSPVPMVRNANNARRYGLRRLAPMLRHWSRQRALRSSPVNPEIAIATTFRSPGPLDVPAKTQTRNK